VNKHYHSTNRDSIEFESFRDWLFLTPEPLYAQFDRYIDSQWETPPDIQDGKYRAIVLTAGAFAGVVSRTVTAPVDRLKILYQAGGNANTSIKQLAIKVNKDGGFRAFWRANGVNVLKVMPEKSLKVFMYEYLKSIICEQPEKPTKTERFASGAFAGAIAQLFIYPMEITKTRIAVSKKGQVNGIAPTIRMIVAEEGLSGLYRGSAASILGIMPYSGTSLMVYNLLRHRYMDFYDKEPGTPVVSGIGAVAAICGTSVSYPLQLIRTRLQCYGRNPEYCGLDRGRPTITGVLRHIWQKRGFLGLYTGMSCNLLKGVPATSITFVVYEKSRAWLRQLVYGD